MRWINESFPAAMKFLDCQGISATLIWDDSDWGNEVWPWILVIKRWSLACFNISNSWLVNHIKYQNQQQYNKAEAFMIIITIISLFEVTIRFEEDNNHSLQEQITKILSIFLLGSAAHQMIVCHQRFDPSWKFELYFHLVSFLFSISGLISIQHHYLKSHHLSKHGKLVTLDFEPYFGRWTFSHVT